MNPRIIIEVVDKNAHLLYQIDFQTFMNQIENIPRVEVIDNLCFAETLLIGMIVTNSDNLDLVSTMEKVKAFFKDRWKIGDSNIIITFDNNVHLLDYKKLL